MEPQENLISVNLLLAYLYSISLQLIIYTKHQKYASSGFKHCQF